MAETHCKFCKRAIEWSGKYWLDGYITPEVCEANPGAGIFHAPLAPHQRDIDAAASSVSEVEVRWRAS